MRIEEYDFTDRADYYEFYLRVAQSQMGYDPDKTPPHFVDLVRHIAHAYDRGGPHLIEAFRGFGKSTGIRTSVAAEITLNQSTSFMMVSVNEQVIANHSSAIRRMLRNHEVSKLQFGKLKFDEFNANSVRLPDNLHEMPNLAIKKPSQEITGARATWGILDDLESAGISRKPALHERIKDVIIPEMSVVARGRYIMIGTPHVPADECIYTQKENELSPERIIKIPWDKEKYGYWYTDEEIEHMRAELGEAGWETQMMLIPRDLEEGDLIAKYWKPYSETISIRMGEMRLGSYELKAVTAAWDPATGQNNDNSVLAIVFQSKNDHYFVHRCVVLPATSQADDDYMRNQYRVILSLLDQFKVPIIYVEESSTTGHRAGFSRYAKKMGHNITAIGFKPTRMNKKMRIGLAIESLLNTGRLHVHDSSEAYVKKETRKFPLEGKGITDDGLDAITMCINHLADPEVATPRITDETYDHFLENSAYSQKVID